MNKSRPPRSGRPLWRCPDCDRQFANVNQSHSCGKYTVDDFLRGKSELAIRLFNALRAAVEACGPVTLAPAKTRVGFQCRMIFAAVNRLAKDSLAGHVVLARRLENSRFTKIESISPGNHVHHFVLTCLQDIDDELRGWLREACEVGQQKHLSPQPATRPSSRRG